MNSIIINGNIKLVYAKGSSHNWKRIEVHELRANGDWLYIKSIAFNSIHETDNISINGVTIYIGTDHSFAVVRLIKGYYRVHTYVFGETSPKLGVMFKDYQDNFVLFYDKYTKMMDNILRMTN